MALSASERNLIAGLGVLFVALAVVHEAAEIRNLGTTLSSRMLEDYYAVLGAEETANDESLKLAMKRTLLKLDLDHRDSDESRIKRTRVTAAYEALLDPEVRKVHDQQRKVVRIATMLLMAIGVLGLLACCGLFFSRLLRCAMRRGPYGLDGGSVEGRVLSIFPHVEASVEVQIVRGSAEDKLGLKLNPVPSKSGDALQVASLAPNSVASAHNAAERESRGDKPAWWSSTAVWAGDLVVAVNGSNDIQSMMESLRTATSMTLSIRRMQKHQALMPWLTEAELQRKPGERWGCQLVQVSDGSASLQVISLDPDGAVAAWNRSHPHLALMVGDRVVAVEDKLGVKRMLTVLQDAQRLQSRWMVLRGVLASPPPPERVSGPFHKQGQQKLGLRIGRALERRVNGTFVEPSIDSLFVVKEVRPGYVVDEWNKTQPESAQVREGAIVLAVNEVTVPQKFVAELGKPTVRLRTRMPLGAHGGSAAPDNASNLSTLKAPVADAPAAGAVAQASSSPGLWQSFKSLFFTPRTFEDNVRQRLLKVRYEFDVNVTREAGLKVGLTLKPPDGRLAGLHVEGVAPDTLVAKSSPVVKVGDLLASVNGIASPGMMLELLSDQNVPELRLHFSRKAVDASPGLWEAEIERRHGEGWGMELKVGKGESGMLDISNISVGLAVDRWNQGCPERGTWPIASGDCLAAVEPEVDPQLMLAKLQSAAKVKVMILRWHSGPAPTARAYKSTAQVPAVPKYTFDVTLEKMRPTDRLGLRLEPCPLDPSRTVVADVVTGGLVDTYNRRTVLTGGLSADKVVRAGDSVESVNGETDASRFTECCSAHRLRICLARPLQEAISSTTFVAPHAQKDEVKKEEAEKVALQQQDLSSTSSVAPPPRREELQSQMSQHELTARAVAVAPAAPSPPSVVAPQALREDLQDQMSAVVAHDQPADSVGPLAASTGIPVVNTTMVPQSPSASSQAGASPEDKREMFLLRTELEQLRRRLAADADSAKLEMARWQRQCEELQGENERLRAERSQVQSCREVTTEERERDRLELKRSADEAELHLQRSADEIARLRAQISASKSEVATQQLHLQDALNRADELAASNAELRDENERLRAAPTMQRGDRDTSRSPTSSGMDIHGVREQLSQLQDLASSIHQVLAQEPDIQHAG